VKEKVMKGKYATVTNTDGLLAMARTSSGRNREANIEELQQWLDPDGCHVLCMHFIHEHVMGEPVEPHMRTQWMAKVKEDAPKASYKYGKASWDVWMDVDLDKLEMLSVKLPSKK
jgi:hypothetical protein